MTTKEEILLHTYPILAREGYAGTTMRKVSATISKEPSIIYAHFADKEDLLAAVREHINSHLMNEATKIKAAPAQEKLSRMLRFQLDNREMIVALLQYFMASPQHFTRGQNGYVPERAYAHITELIMQGIDEGVYYSDNIPADAKATAHLINGYLMEYFDRKLARKEYEDIIDQLASYINRALMNTRTNP